MLACGVVQRGIEGRERSGFLLVRAIRDTTGVIDEGRGDKFPLAPDHAEATLDLCRIEDGSRYVVGVLCGSVLLRAIQPGCRASYRQMPGFEIESIRR